MTIDCPLPLRACTDFVRIGVPYSLSINICTVIHLDNRFCSNIAHSKPHPRKPNDHGARDSHCAEYLAGTYCQLSHVLVELQRAAIAAKVTRRTGQESSLVMAGELLQFTVLHVAVDVVLHLEPVDHLLYALQLGRRVGRHSGDHRRWLSRRRYCGSTSLRRGRRRWVLGGSGGH